MHIKTGKSSKKTDLKQMVIIESIIGTYKAVVCSCRGWRKMSDSFTVQKSRIEQVDPNDQVEVEKIRFENQMLLDTGWLTLSQFETLTALLRRRIDPPESAPEK